MLKSLVQSFLRRFGYEICRVDPKIIKRLESHQVEILNDEDFQRSVKETKDKTLLDTPRLANLWQLCKLSNPQGAMIEIGSYKGGGALHLSNCCPERKIYLCDSFQGFETLDQKLDTNFNATMFIDTTQTEVAKLFSNKNRNYEILAGLFPASCSGKKLPPVSFVHLDVDVYKSTKESLGFLAPLMLPRSIIVLDDYFREARGVNQAVEEFLATHPHWKVFPMFPGQGVLISNP